MSDDIETAPCPAGDDIETAPCPPGDDIETAPCPPGGRRDRRSRVPRPRPRRRPGGPTVSLLMVASLVVGLSCSDDADADDAVPTTATASTAPGAVPPAPSTVPPPATTTTLAGLPLPSVPVSVLIDQLVPAVDAGDEGYARAQFGVGWVDADGDGCDTRDEVLIAESVSPAEVDPSGCVVLAGDWVSPYDGHATPDPSELEVDHVVDLAEAWRSGAWAWTPERRVAYANDLDNPGTLVAVTAATNRSKRDRDPTSWQPPDGDSWCAYAAAWAQTKTTWGLTADPGEVAALRAITISC